MTRSVRLLVSMALGATLLAPLAGAAHATPAHTKATVAHTGYSRATTIARAKTWLTADKGHQVPYSQSSKFGGYRTDCSGYVSMALQLPKQPYTVQLASKAYSTKITMAQLRQGDLVIDATGDSNHRHAVIFDHWIDAKHTRYYAYEQRGGHGTDYRPENYGVGKDQYDAYRPNKY